MSYLVRWCVAVIAGAVAFVPAFVFNQLILLPLSLVVYVAVFVLWTDLEPT